MAQQRDLGTAILNIKIAFQQVSKADIQKQVKNVAAAVSGAMQTIKTTLTPSSGSTGLNKWLDDITKTADAIENLTDLVNRLKAAQATAQGSGAAFTQMEQLAKAEKALRAAQERMNVLQTKNRAAPDERIGDAPASRVRELDRANKKLETQAQGARKVVRALKELQRAFLETEQSQKQLSSANKASQNTIEKFFSSFVKTANRTKDFSGAIQGVAAEYARMRKGIKATVTDLRLQDVALKAAEQQARSTIEILSKAQKLNEQSKGKKLISEYLTNLRAITAGAPLDTLKKQRAAILALIPSFDKLGVSTQKLRNEVTRLDNRIKALKLKELKEQLNNVKKIFHQVTSGVSQTGEQIRRVSFILRDIGRQLMTISKTMFGFMEPVFEDYMKFEQAVTDVLAITGELNNGLTKTDIVASDLGQTILALAGQFVFSAEEIAETAKQLALAGFSVEQISKSLKSVILLASATGSELSTAGNIITTSMAVFSLQADQTSRVADLFTATVTRANTNLSQLGEAFKIVAPVAAASGQSIEQTAAALGILANAGLRGSLAGIGLARILTQLTEKAGELDEMLKPLGSSFAALDPERNTIADIVAEFDRLNLSSASLRSLFDLRAFRALNAILAQGANRVGAFADQLDRAARVSEAIAGARLNTLAGGVQLLSDSFNALRIAIGDVLGEDLRQIVLFLRDVVVFSKEFAEANKDSIRPLLKFFVAATGVIGALGTSLFAVGSAASFAAAPLIAAGSALAGLTLIVSSSVLAVFLGLASTITTALAGVVAAVATLTAIFAAIMAGAISAATAVTISIAMYTEKWTAFFKTVGNALMSFYDTVIVPIGQGFSNNSKVILDATDRLIKSLSNLLNRSTDILADGNWELFGAQLANIVAIILDLITFTVDQLVPYLLSAVQAIVLLTHVSDVLVASLDTIIDAGKLIVVILNQWLMLMTGITPFIMIYDTIANSGKKAADELKGLNEQFNAQKEALAGTLAAANEYSKALGKVVSTLKNIAAAKPVELKELDTLAEQGKLSPQGRSVAIADIDKQIAAMESIRQSYKDAIAAGQTVSSDQRDVVKQASAKLKELQAARESLIENGKQLDKFASLISGSVEKNTENLSKVIKDEQARLESLTAVADTIGKAVVNPELKANSAQVKEILDTLKGLGISVEVDADFKKNPINALQDVLKNDVAKAMEQSGMDIEQAEKLLLIIDKISGTDVYSKGGFDKIGEVLAEVQQNQKELTDKMDAATSRRLDLEKELSKIGKSAHQIKLEEIEEERVARLAIFEEEERLLKIRRAMLRAEIAKDKAIGADVTTKEKELAAIEAFSSFDEQGNEVFFADMKDKVNSDASRKRDEEAKQEAKERADAVAAFERERDELILETATDVQERIAARTRLIKAKRAKELQDSIDSLKKAALPGEDTAAREKELTDLNKAATDAEVAKMIEDENKDANKDMIKSVDKRLDLESEMVSQMAKQAKTLGDMVQLTNFLDFLQRRKDRAALAAVRELNRERKKLADLEARAASGDPKAARALEAQRDIVNLMAGRVANRNQQAGAGMGNPGNVFNLDAMVAGLDGALANFVQKLKDNPIIIPARFDMNMLKEDLTNLMKGFNMADMVPQGGAPKLPGDAGDKLASRGGVVNHNDNKQININVNRMDNNLANRLGILA